MGFYSLSSIGCRDELRHSFKSDASSEVKQLPLWFQYAVIQIGPPVTDCQFRPPRSTVTPDRDTRAVTQLTRFAHLPHFMETCEE